MLIVIKSICLSFFSVYNGLFIDTGINSNELQKNYYTDIQHNDILS